MNENIIFRSKDAEGQPIDIDDDEIVSNITKKKILIKNLLNITGVLKEIKKNIYNALIYYWNISNEFGLIAALLNPHYKNLDFVDNEDKK